jgi:large subunit ribosomal protein L34
MRITFKPHNRHIKRNQGFRARMKTKDGRRVLSRRRTHGRHKLVTIQ